MQNKIVKSAKEISAIKKAAVIIDDTYDYILSVVREGMTEIELANLIEKKVLALGGSSLSFPSIVAFGESGCEPHHVPTDKKLEKGVLVTTDIGAVFDGYCSDFTRTFAFGEVGKEEKEIYEIVYQSQKLGLKAVEAKVNCKDVDTVCRDYIAKFGYGEFYIHNTGHGVGQLIHEEPYLKQASDEVLENNMVVTIEPGIYLPARCGCRIEDMIVVGEKSPVSRHATELITVK
ncbi:MAG: M24 family metallopeptidase [Clostridia bacterium]